MLRHRGFHLGAPRGKRNPLSIFQSRLPYIRVLPGRKIKQLASLSRLSSNRSIRFYPRYDSGGRPGGKFRDKIIGARIE